MVIYMLVVPLSLIYCLSMQRPGNPKMSVVYCGAPLYHDPMPLDNLKTYTYT